MQGSLAVFRFHFVARRHFQGLSSPIAVSCVREAPMAFENREKSVSRVPVEQPPADEGRRGELPVANTPSVGRDEPGRDELGGRGMLEATHCRPSDIRMGAADT